MDEKEKFSSRSASLDRSQLHLDLHNCAAPERSRNSRCPLPIPPPPQPVTSDVVESPLWTINRKVRPDDLKNIKHIFAAPQRVVTNGQLMLTNGQQMDTSAEVDESPLWSTVPTVRPTDNPISMTEKSFALRLMLSKDPATVSCCRNADSPVADLKKLWNAKKPMDANGNPLNKKSSKYWTKRIFNIRFKNGAVVN